MDSIVVILDFNAAESYIPSNKQRVGIIFAEDSLTANSEIYSFESEMKMSFNSPDEYHGILPLK
ncbi:MAG: hypothetical protein IPJ75_15970 [Ignavibacteriales bacterium]|nr:hypothetical protein [Ignavibacteriales bacterium]